MGNINEVPPDLIAYKSQTFESLQKANRESHWDQTTFGINVDEKIRPLFFSISKLCLEFLPAFEVSKIS